LFIVKHVPRGTYRVQASARGFADERTEAFELLADRSGLELRLVPLGSIVGTVSGVSPGELGETRVGAVIVPEGDAGGLGGMFGRGRGRNGFKTAEVAAVGSYRIEAVEPGNYVVRSWVGSPQQLMRDLAPQVLTGTLLPDIVVRGGAETRYDLALIRPAIGKVVGNVLHNGNPANGFRVELSRQDETGTALPEPGERGGPGGRRRGNWGRTFNATVNQNGAFSIDEVPEGIYQLRISGARRGGDLHEETVQVLGDVTTERSYSLQTSSLRGTITRDDGGDAKQLGGRISLLPNQTVVPEDLNAWLRQNPSFDARVVDGGFTFESIPPGSYLLVAQIRERERVSQMITVQGDQEIRVAAGTATPAANGPAGGGNR
jgi:hypothetical protein